MVNFLDVVGFEGLYKVSESGDIFSIARNGTKGGRLKPGIDRYGYFKVVLYKGNERYYHTIHRLVAMAFVPNPYNKNTVNHIDGNKKNNNCSNLEWLTAGENLDHSFSINKQPFPKQKIIAENIKTHEIMIFDSQHDASRKLNINQSNVHRVLKGEYKQVKGFRFLRNEG